MGNDEGMTPSTWLLLTPAAEAPAELSGLVGVC